MPSPSTRKRDQELKRLLYERTGVREYWMVDPEHNRITRYSRAADGSFSLQPYVTAEGRDTLETPLLPGWSLALQRFFR